MKPRILYTKPSITDLEVRYATDAAANGWGDQCYAYTGVRDYIHVQDLAEGHIAALTALAQGGERLITVNLGTGKGCSVLEMVKAFEAASGKPIPYKIAKRRPGDIAQCYADPALAKAKLGWVAKRGIDDMCRDTWRWQEYSKGFDL